MKRGRVVKPTQMKSAHTTKTATTAAAAATTKRYGEIGGEGGRRAEEAVCAPFFFCFLLVRGRGVRVYEIDK